jgi:hypothetical protein
LALLLSVTASIPCPIIAYELILLKTSAAEYPKDWVQNHIKISACFGVASGGREVVLSSLLRYYAPLRLPPRSLPLHL